ncbi:transcription antitermination factor NusB [Actinospongicola halichondriae]|uniref:transcription antitermination factor NusB n=1 Tax=Actinospongicola halichondriae TaxID=3236844 RepID=UPI003D4D6EF9
MSDDVGVLTRRTAIDALVRIETDGAYANLATNAILDRSPLEPRDRRFVTELVYGTCRMTRACDHLIDRHRRGDVSARVQAALRLGTYQLAFAGVAAHASVDATVGASPRPARGLVNAVLRRVSRDVRDGIAWPSEGVQLSYPDWIVRSYQQFLGVEQAHLALEAMNTPATTHTRLDGYVQDLASQEVVEAVGAVPGERVLDLCAAPGGKATGLTALGAEVIAADLSPGRLALVVDNAQKVGARLPVVAADGVHPPFAPGSFDRVLVDAPCSGLGVLRRRPDARWRIDAGAPDRLASLQVQILEAAADLVAPGGLLVYSVCTLTEAETDGVIAAVDLPSGYVFGDRSVLSPDAQRDGMFLATWRRR